MEVKLNELSTALDGIEYPASREEVTEHLNAVTVLLADGETSLSDVVSEIDEKRFETETELTEEIYANLPTEAVGEPGQSEGDA